MNSAHFVHLDNLSFHANVRYEPGLAIRVLAPSGVMQIDWSGVPGRSYRVHRGTTLSAPLPVWAIGLLCPAEGKLAYEFTPDGPQEFYNISEQFE